MSKADHIEAPTLTRREQETEQWKESLQSYKDLMVEGWDGVLERGHPLEQWVQRQRKHHRSGVLLPWKLEALKLAGFEFVAPRVDAVPTDQEYAQQLVTFHRANGHYAPTQTHGGAGLTKWLMRLREKGKESGNGYQIDDSAWDALQILIRGIPGFMLYGPTKVDINEEQGLAFNGFKRSVGPAARPRVLDDRIQASLALAKRYSKIDLRSGPLQKDSDEIEGLLNVIERAVWFRQALSVKSLGSINKKATDTNIWWLSGAKVVKGFSPIHGNCIELRAENLERTASGHKKERKWLIKYAIDPWYLDSGELYGIEVVDITKYVHDDDKEWLEIGYDVALADQMKDASCPIGEEGEQREGSDWKRWLDGDGPSKRSTSVTTANQHFLDNFTALEEWVGQQKINGGGRSYRPHLNWNEEKLHYKFIEHMLKKSRAGVMQFSHAERLKELDVTWGQQKRTLAELFWNS